VDVILLTVFDDRGGYATDTIAVTMLNLEVFDTGGVVLAREAARNHRALRSRGHTVRKTIDGLIATFCLREQHSLLHRDRDFDAFEKLLELSVIHLDWHPESAGFLESRTPYLPYG
jgi:hypothetical protein